MVTLVYRVSQNSWSARYHLKEETKPINSPPFRGEVWPQNSEKCAVSEIFYEKDLLWRPIEDELTSSTATLPLLGTRKEAVEL